MITCPACGEAVQLLTKAHCLRRHGMDRQYLIEQYGEPQPIKSTYSSEYHRWLRKESVVINNSDYAVAQASIRSVRGK